MSNDLLTWNCGARDNAWPKKPSPTNLLMRDRQTVSLPPSKAGKRFQCLASKAGRTSSFWMLPTAVCHREKLKRYQCSQTTRAGNDGSNRNGGGTRWACRSRAPFRRRRTARGMELQDERNRCLLVCRRLQSYIVRSQGECL